MAYIHRLPRPTRDSALNRKRVFFLLSEQDRYLGRAESSAEVTDIPPALPVCKEQRRLFLCLEPPVLD